MLADIQEIHPQGFMLDGIAVRKIGKDMALHPVQLIDDNTEKGCTVRHKDCTYLLERLDEDHVVDHGADAADPFGEEHDLLPWPSPHDSLYPLFHVPEFHLC